MDLPLQLSEHSVAPPSLAPFDGMREHVAALNAACRAGSTDARIHAALANMLVRESMYFDALETYRNATVLDPTFAAAHLALSELAYMLHDEATSNEYRARALALTRVYPDPLPAGNRIPVLLLLRDAPYGLNAPVEMLIDRSRYAVHKYYVGGGSTPPLPPYDVAMAAFGHAGDDAAEHAAAFLDRERPPALNNPRRFALFARERLADALAAIDGLVAVPSERVAREALSACDGTWLVRPADTHAGDGLALVDSDATLRGHIERFPAAAYHVAPFVDYRSSDGLFRKYRIVVVDGIAYPYHLAIAPRWMVHYHSSSTRDHAWMREEELAFLAQPAAAIPRWTTLMPAIAAAIGVDYFGIDAAMLPDGRLLVFEADSAMLVHDEDPDGVLAPKRPYVARIREALHAAIDRRGKDASAGERKSQA